MTGEKRIEAYLAGTKTVDGIPGNPRRTELMLSSDVRIVGCAVQQGRHRILAEVPVAKADEVAPLQTRIFMLVGQGEAIPYFWHYLCQVAPEAGAPPTYLYEIPHTDDTDPLS
jgi:hypothetical protein